MSEFSRQSSPIPASSGQASTEALVLPASDQARQIRDAAVRIVGAEIYLCQVRVMAALGCGELPSIGALCVFGNHISMLAGEFASQQEVSPKNSIEQQIVELSRLSGQFIREFEKRDSSIGYLKHISEDYFRAVIPLYQRLNAKTVLSHLPGASDLGLQLIEFNTDMSGYCPEILGPIETLEKQLLIDVSLGKPQEGFGGVLSVEQLLDILHLRQSRVFVAMMNGEVCGFYLPVLNPASVREYAGAHFDELVDLDIIARDSSPGWVHITGTAKSNRLMMAKAGIHLYGLFDQVVMQDAAKEGLTVLLGAVREGENANTAINSHHRFGWKSTDHVFLGADGITPYRTIIRPVSKAQDFTGAHAEIGLGSHFEVYAGAPAIADRGIEQVQNLISYEEALIRCRNFLGNDDPHIRVQSLDGAYGHYLIMHHGTSSYGTIHSLQQVRPGVDYWQYLQGREGQDLGPIDEMLPLIAADMGLISARPNLCFDE